MNRILHSDRHNQCSAKESRMLCFRRGEMPRHRPQLQQHVNIGRGFANHCNYQMGQRRERLSSYMNVCRMPARNYQHCVQRVIRPQFGNSYLHPIHAMRQPVAPLYRPYHMPRYSMGFVPRYPWLYAPRARYPMYNNRMPMVYPVAFGSYQPQGRQYPSQRPSAPRYDQDHCWNPEEGGYGYQGNFPPGSARTQLPDVWPGGPTPSPAPVPTPASPLPPVEHGFSDEEMAERARQARTNQPRPNSAPVLPVPPTTPPPPAPTPPTPEVPPSTVENAQRQLSSAIQGNYNSSILWMPVGNEWNLRIVEPITPPNAMGATSRSVNIRMVYQNGQWQLQDYQLDGGQRIDRAQAISMFGISGIVTPDFIRLIFAPSNP